MYALITTRLDYCCSLYAGILLECLGRVLYSAGRLICGIPKFGYVSLNMHNMFADILLSKQILYRMASLFWLCLFGIASV